MEISLGIAKIMIAHFVHYRKMMKGPSCKVTIIIIGCLFTYPFIVDAKHDT